MATSSVILGIIGFLGLSCVGTGAILSFIGLILGLVAKSRGNTSGRCTAGIVLGWIGTLLVVLFLLAVSIRAVIDQQSILPRY